ncbi:universal stress protein [Actinokineospora iranica]|uniref:Nucleotide-binding universal stress protein, UspA family n=1 Tax=Actinokineospora iranica TaxID=1271860 RepID=A0A1G6JRK7_9PSEU|nr:universal stress protein [Actinokineospora iranica]SDC21380.1 Nucleotide-binding universal stress protein, UspA family [Actinokineospora iranica]
MTEQPTPTSAPVQRPAAEPTADVTEERAPETAGAHAAGEPAGPLPVLVAVDGSESAARALRWAAAEADRRGAWLRVITVYPWPITGYPGGLVTGGELHRGLRSQAEDTLHAALAAVRDQAPGLTVRGEVRSGDVTPILVAASREAALTVLGSRGLGGFSGLLLGSTASAVIAHGHNPVVVVRGEGPVPASGKIVVGVDGGPGDEAVLAFAFEHAVETGAGVVAAHAWSDSLLDAAYTAGYAALDWGVLAQEARDLLTEALAPWRAKYPDVPVEPVVARSRPARLLLEQAADAALVVVGSRGRGGFTGLVLGSVSQALTRHAPCPVAVVRVDRRD